MFIGSGGLGLGQVWIDTMGVPFAYPLVRLAGVRTVAYVHYPFISTDMLQRVAEQSEMYNNSAEVAESSLMSIFKLQYYYVLAFFYGIAGFFADVIPLPVPMMTEAPPPPAPKTTL